MFRTLILTTFFIFSYSLIITYSDKVDRVDFTPTELRYMDIKDFTNSVKFPFSSFSGYFLFLKNHQENKNSYATAFSISSSDGMWLTAAHAVENCWAILIDKNGEDWAFVDEIVIHPNADVALLKTPLSAPSIPVLSKESWIPSKSYFMGFSSGKLNIGMLNVKGWTKALDDKHNYAFDVFLWELRTALDFNRKFGMSGGPILDMEGNAIGVIVAYDGNGYLSSVPTYFLEELVESEGVKLKQKEVPSGKDLDYNFLSNKAARMNNSGSIKRIQCIREPSEDLMKLAKVKTNVDT